MPNLGCFPEEGLLPVDSVCGQLDLGLLHGCPLPADEALQLLLHSCTPTASSSSHHLVLQFYFPLYKIPCDKSPYPKSLGINVKKLHDVSYLCTVVA